MKHAYAINSCLALLSRRVNHYDSHMDFASYYHEVNERWLLKRASLSKDEIKIIANKDTIRNAIIGFMTRTYYQREKLIKTSEIFYGYVFQDFLFRQEAHGDYTTWVLHSPSREVNEHPEIYKDVVAKLMELKKVRRPEKALRPLQDVIALPLADACYLEVDKRYTGGHLIYLSTIFFFNRSVPDFKLGINLLLANQSASKEVLYLPEKLWDDEWKEAYSKGENVI